MRCSELTPKKNLQLGPKEIHKTLTPKTVKRSVMKKRRGLWPIQHRVAMRKNCSWAIWRTDLEANNSTH